MSKFLSTLLASAMSLGALAGPAFAASEKAGLDSKTHFEETAILPIKMAAVTSALAIGTPIALLRGQAQELHTYGTAMADEMNRNQIITPLMVASLPGQSLRMIGNVGKSLVNSTDKAFSAWDEPFTAKSFSLDELD